MKMAPISIFAYGLMSLVLENRINSLGQRVYPPFERLGFVSFSAPESNEIGGYDRIAKDIKEGKLKFESDGKGG